LGSTQAFLPLEVEVTASSTASAPHLPHEPHDVRIVQ
jgi:hypothetical protein